MSYFLIIAAACMRLLPHPPNFTPLGAMSLFGGTYLNKKIALIMPLVAMFISDLFLGFYSIWIMASVYGSFLLIALIGLWLRKHRSWPNIIGASLFGSIIFYLITNFAVWAATPMYAKTFAGLIQCYYMALPFFRNSLAGDLFYVGVIFGTYELVQWMVRRKKISEKFAKILS